MANAASCLAFLGLFLIPLGGAACAEDPPDERTKDPDFQVQGEYLGTLQVDEVKTLGVQVIALGDHKFRAVAYFGGLPGGGWDGSDAHETDGEIRGGVATFARDDREAKIQNGVMSITFGEQKIGELKKEHRKSPTLGERPPAGAIVLFDGTGADKFEKGRITDDGLLIQGTTSKQKFQSCKLHAEFRTPFLPTARGQGRGNSGVYLQGRYEVQVLDSFGLKGEDNECGGIYGISAPKVNMCFPPLAWQTYDLDYTTARFEDRKKVQDATITVRHNGVLVQDAVKLTHATTAAPLAEGPEPGPLYMQDHGNPVRYRNIWVVESK